MWAAKCDGCHGFVEVEEARGFPQGWGYLSGFGIQRALCTSCLELANTALPKPYVPPVLNEIPSVDLPPSTDQGPLPASVLERVHNSPEETLRAHAKCLLPDDPLRIACAQELERRGVSVGE